MAVGKPWEIDLSIYDDDPELLAGLQRGDRVAILRAANVLSISHSSWRGGDVAD